MSENKKALVSKLVQVLKDAEFVKKSGTNKHLGFDYSLESDILEVIRKGLVKHNVFAFTSVEGVEKLEQLTTCKLKITFVDGDTGEEYSIFSFGTGQDNRDFGLGKSVTNAFKMAWTKNFMLIGEMLDIENDGETPVKQQPKAEKKEAKKEQSTENSAPKGFVQPKKAEVKSTNSGFTKKQTEEKQPKPAFKAPAIQEPKVEAPAPKPVDDDDEDF